MFSITAKTFTIYTRRTTTITTQIGQTSRVFFAVFLAS